MYNTNKLPNFGIEVKDTKLYDLTKGDYNLLQGKLRHDILHHKLVVFRNQGILTGDEFIEIASLLGEIDGRGFAEHALSSNPLILRLSNDSMHGFTHFGNSGFHYDGAFLDKPNDYSLYHIVTVPQKGGTVFVPLREIYHKLAKTVQNKWERLWFVWAYKNITGYTDKPSFVVQPLVYFHPVSQEKVLCLSQGKVTRFVWDYGSNHEDECSKEETEMLEKEIQQELEKHRETLWYHHNYQPGDLVITDNLAVAHWAHPDNQLPTEEIGLRVLHRIIIKGNYNLKHYKQLHEHSE